MSLRIQWADGDVVLNYNVSGDPVAKIHKVWVDHNVFEGGSKGMRIHVKFDAWYMQFDDGRVLAYFRFRDGDALKDFNNRFHTADGKVAAWRDFTPPHLRTIYNDLSFFMPYDELHFNGDGKWELMFILQIYHKDNRKFIHVSDHKVYFTYTRG